MVPAPASFAVRVYTPRFVSFHIPFSFVFGSISVSYLYLLALGLSQVHDPKFAAPLCIQNVNRQMLSSVSISNDFRPPRTSSIILFEDSQEGREAEEVQLLLRISHLCELSLNDRLEVSDSDLY